MYGIPDDPDLLFDVRFLPNPFYDQKLRLKTGEEKEVSNYVFSNNDADIFLDKLDDMIKFLIPRYIDEGKSALVIGIGCTGGQHRSVAIASALKERLDNIEGIGVRLEHRDMGKNISRISQR